jgi:hypothetical protein
MYVPTDDVAEFIFYMMSTTIWHSIQEEDIADLLRKQFSHLTSEEVNQLVALVRHRNFKEFPDIVKKISKSINFFALDPFWVYKRTFLTSTPHFIYYTSAFVKTSALQNQKLIDGPIRIRFIDPTFDFLTVRSINDIATATAATGGTTTTATTTTTTTTSTTAANTTCKLVKGGRGEKSGGHSTFLRIIIESNDEEIDFNVIKIMVRSVQQHYVLPFYMGWKYTFTKSADSSNSISEGDNNGRSTAPPEYFKIPGNHNDGCKNAVERVAILLQALLAYVTKNNDQTEEEEEELEQGLIVIPEGFGTLLFTRVPNFQLLLHTFTSVYATCIEYKILTPTSSPLRPPPSSDMNDMATSTVAAFTTAQNDSSSMNRQDDIYSVRSEKDTGVDDASGTTAVPPFPPTTSRFVRRHKITFIVLFGSHAFVYRRRIDPPSFMLEYRPTIYLDFVDSRFGIEAVSESGTKHLGLNVVKYDGQLLEWPYWIYTDGRDVGKNSLVSYEDTDGYETCIIYNKRGQVIRAWRRLAVSPASPPHPRVEDSL